MDPVDERQPISEPQTERILAPVTMPGFPALITKEVHEQPLEPSKDHDFPYSYQAKPSHEKGDSSSSSSSSSSSPVLSSDSEQEMQKEHRPSPHDELDGRPPEQFLRDRLATDSRFQKVLPDPSESRMRTLPTARVPVMDRSQHGTPPQSPRVPPQRHNTPHSPLGSKETSPRASPIFGTFGGLFFEICSDYLVYMIVY